MRVTDVVREADRPVAEDRARALAINEALREPLSEFLDEKQTKLRYAVGIGAATAVVGIVALGIVDGALVGGGLFLLGLAIAGGGYAYLNDQSPDVTVRSVQKGYWTAHSLPVQDGSILYDATQSIETTSFDLEQLTDHDKIAAANDTLADVSEYPVVMAQDENVEDTLTETLDEITTEIETAEEFTVEAPIIPATGSERAAIETLLEMADPDDTVDADFDIPVDQARTDIQELDELEQMAASDGAESELEELSDTSRTLVDDLSGMQETAVDLLNDHIGTAADAFGLVSYNFYCPDCQTDDIDSVVELTDPQAGSWYCETCRTTHDTSAVIPRHRLKDDLVNPVWDQLWIEKDDQRREVYENIEDQKADLQEREFEQRSEEIRSTTDRIRDLRSRIRDLKTEAKAAEGKVSEIGDLMVKYERIHDERKQAFEQEVESSFAEIDEETEEILEQTRNEEQERIEEAEQAAKEKAEMMREEKRRREIEKFVAEQQLEDQRTRATLAQQADRHDEEMEMQRRQHREEWMLETRGRTSFSGRIDKARMKKDRLLGASAGGDS
ncbi:hypothetical protein [Halorientalis regularis]|jgi:hypothetical protein|uniref:Uncharacterized protein n=1 Tax=Halorientalis regularis TaxID=660518 RepID=A0A1G7PVW3_9EURY|nr:hypothetical protein [Halorientalis regularis]SDF90365.1 hypothetical protein SAMN05216218_11141 [Halorientalis regularis]